MNSMMEKPTSTSTAQERGSFTSPAATAPRPAPARAVRLDLLRSLRMHPRMAISVALGVFVMVASFAMTRKPVYKATSLLYVEPLATKVLSDGTSGIYDPSRYDSYLQQQLQTVQRKDILAVAVEQLPEGVWRFPHETEDSAISRLQAALKVERVQTSYQIEVSLMDGNPETAAKVVNAVVTAYLKQGRKEDHARADEKLQLLTEERGRIQAELADDKTEQAALSASLGVANPAGEMGNQYDMQLAGVRSQLAAAREAHDVAAAQLSSVVSAGGGKTAGLVATADDLIAGDAGLSSMKATISQRRAVLSGQMSGLTPSNPAYKQDQDEIAGLDRSLEKMTVQLRDQAERRVQDKLRLDLQRTGDVESRLNSQLAKQTSNATSAAPKLQRATELAADMQRLTARYASVDDAIRGLQLETDGPGAAHLSLAAEVPASPEPSKQKFLLVMAFPLAMFFGCMAAIFARKRDPRVYTGYDLAEVLSFQPMGVVPAWHEVSSAVIDEYSLRIAAALQSAYRASNARSYVFTAASPQVDVHRSVETVGRKLEELGFTTLIVDVSSLLRPVGDETGLALDGARDGFAAAHLEHLEKTSDIVLIDAPALLHSASTEYAARCADVTILVAEAGVTTRADLEQSAALLRRLHVPGVASMLQELQMKYEGAGFKSRIAAIDSKGSARVEVGNRNRRRSDKADLIGNSDAKISSGTVEAVAPADVVATIQVKEIVKTPIMVKAEEPIVAAKAEKAGSVWMERLLNLNNDEVLSIVPEAEEYVALPVEKKVVMVDEVVREAPAPAVMVPVAAPVAAPVASKVDDLIVFAETAKSAPVVKLVDEVVLMQPVVAEVAAKVEIADRVIEAPAVILVNAKPVRVPAPSLAAAAFASTVPVAVAEAKKSDDEWGWVSADFAPKPLAAFKAPAVTTSVAPAAMASAPVAPVAAKISASVQTWTRATPPLTLAAFPGVASQVAAPRVVESQPLTAPVTAPAPRLRAGLVKAAAFQAPSRASEGLEATKQAAERRAVRATDRRKNTAAVAVSSAQDASLTRRWGMLSRFDHGQLLSRRDDVLELIPATGAMGDR